MIQRSIGVIGSPDADGRGSVTFVRTHPQTKTRNRRRAAHTLDPLSDARRPPFCRNVSADVAEREGFEPPLGCPKSDFEVTRLFRMISSLPLAVIRNFGFDFASFPR